MVLKEIDYGKVIWVKENGVDVEYILIAKDSYGCELIRKNAVLAKRMNSTNTTDYTDCEMDQYLSSDSAGGFLERFDSDTKAALVMKSISTFSYGDTDCHYISRKCYLPSYGQCFLNNPNTLYPEKSIVPALMLWKNTKDGDQARIAKDNLAASGVNSWLRSPCSATAYWLVNYYGGAYNSNATHTGTWCRPVINVKSNTIVGVDESGNIYLQPIDSHREAEFTYRCGTATVRPKKALVTLASRGLDNIVVQLCNNYGDEYPAWETVTLGEVLEFTNDVNQTDLWQIGIRCYGDTESWQTGFFKEPSVLVEV